MNFKYVFPFIAIIGQETAKKALLLNHINPKIGGVILSGEKGTAKSTMVRGFAALFDDMKLINLPLNITEDRLVGSIDIEKTLAMGKRSIELGILKDAHNNILYIDEVNLLSDYLVNCLLEVAACGINKIEREGISYSHPANFVLIGTMNPEEGILKPQFLDRFGLFLEIEGCSDLDNRIEIMQRRLEYEESPQKFHELWLKETEELAKSIKEARQNLDKVKISDSVLSLAANISTEANCAGHRAELVIIETAKALAALEGKDYITLAHIKEAAEYALPHRKRDLQQEPQMPQEPKEEESKPDNQEPQDPNESPLDEQTPPMEQEETQEQEDETNNGKPQKENSDDFREQVDEIGRTFLVKDLNLKNKSKRKQLGEGKRIKTQSNTSKGQYIRYKMPHGKPKDLALGATIRAAAPHQKNRNKGNLAINIKKTDYREKVREGRTGSTIIFVVDASSSMGVKKRMAEVKGAILSLLSDAYQKRDKVGLIAFRKNEAEILLNITRSVSMAEKSLKTLPTGGKTPLSTGLLKSYEMIAMAEKKCPNLFPIIVLISDGRTNVAINNLDPLEEALLVARKIQKKNIQSIVVDTEHGYVKLGLAKEISQALSAKYFKLSELESNKLAEVVRSFANN